MYFRTKIDAAGEWRWSLHAANHEIIADGAEGYKAKADCLHGIRLVQAGASGATIVDEAESRGLQFARLIVRDDKAT